MKSIAVTLTFLSLLGCAGERFARSGPNPASIPSNMPAAKIQPTLNCTIMPLEPKITLAVPLGLRVSLHNTSGNTVAVPDPTGGRLNWRHHVTVFDANGEPILHRPGESASHEREILAKAGDFIFIRPGATYTFVYWTADTRNPFTLVDGQPPRLRPGKVALVYTFSPDCAVGKNVPLGDAVIWSSSVTAKLPALAVEAADPAAAVQMDLDLLKQHNTPQLRAAVHRNVSYLTCRLFSPDGRTDHLAADLEKWLKAEGARGRQQWIVDALSSKIAAEKSLAREAVIEVRDKPLADAIASELDPRDIETTYRIFEALWANYRDPRALTFARSVFRDGPTLNRVYILDLARRLKIESLVTEGSETLPAWMKREKGEQELGALMRMAARPKSKHALVYLEELDAKHQTPAPKDFILAMCEYKGSAYEPKLIHHLTRNTSEEARLWAAWAMATWGTDNSTDALIAALADASGKVRSNVCYALGRVMQHPTADQYRRAVDGLTRLLPEDASPSLPALNALSQIRSRQPGQ